MWPIKPGNITLRVCADMGWQVMVHCPGCRYSVSVNAAMLAGTKVGAVALEKLLEHGAFVCRTRCPGLAADGLDISCMDVGLNRVIAEWKVSYPNGALNNGSVKLVKSELPKGARPI